MEILDINNKDIIGMTTDTKYSIEKTGDGKIPALWEEFSNIIDDELYKNRIIYAVYSNYSHELDDLKYKITIGFEDEQNIIPQTFNEKITIKSGQYMKFSREGAMPNIVIELWQDIWDYFSSPNAGYERAFTTDFEEYISSNQVNIYVAIK